MIAYNLKSNDKKLLSCEQGEVSAFIKLGDLSRADDHMTTVHEIEHQLQKYREMSELYQSREDVFSLPQTKYAQIELIAKEFEPYANLWKMCSEILHSLPEWIDGSFTEINSKVVATDCDKW